MPGVGNGNGNGNGARVGPLGARSLPMERSTSVRPSVVGGAARRPRGTGSSGEGASSGPLSLRSRSRSRSRQPAPAPASSGLAGVTSEPSPPPSRPRTFGAAPRHIGIRAVLALRSGSGRSLHSWPSTFRVPSSDSAHQVAPTFTRASGCRLPNPTGSRSAGVPSSKPRQRQREKPSPSPTAPPAAGTRLRRLPSSGCRFRASATGGPRCRAPRPPRTPPGSRAAPPAPCRRGSGPGNPMRSDPFGPAASPSIDRPCGSSPFLPTVLMTMPYIALVYWPFSTSSIAAPAASFADTPPAGSSVSVSEQALTVVVLGPLPRVVGADEPHRAVVAAIPSMSASLPPSPNRADSGRRFIGGAGAAVGASPDQSNTRRTLCSSSATTRYLPTATAALASHSPTRLADYWNVGRRGTLGGRRSRDRRLRDRRRAGTGDEPGDDRLVLRRGSRPRPRRSPRSTARRPAA